MLNKSVILSLGAVCALCSSSIQATENPMEQRQATQADEKLARFNTMLASLMEDENTDAKEFNEMLEDSSIDETVRLNAILELVRKEHDSNVWCSNVLCDESINIDKRLDAALEIAEKKGRIPAVSDGYYPSGKTVYMRALETKGVAFLQDCFKFEDKNNLALFSYDDAGRTILHHLFTSGEMKKTNEELKELFGFWYHTSYHRRRFPPRIFNRISERIFGAQVGSGRGKHAELVEPYSNYTDWIANFVLSQDQNDDTSLDCAIRNNINFDMMCGFIDFLYEIISALSVSVESYRATDVSNELFPHAVMVATECKHEDVLYELFNVSFECYERGLLDSYWMFDILDAYGEDNVLSVLKHEVTRVRPWKEDFVSFFKNRNDHRYSQLKLLEDLKKVEVESKESGWNSDQIDFWGSAIIGLEVAIVENLNVELSDLQWFQFKSKWEVKDKIKRVERDLWNHLSSKKEEDLDISEKAEFERLKPIYGSK